MSKIEDQQKKISVLLKEQEQLVQEHKQIQKALLQTEFLPVFMLQDIHLFYVRKKENNHRQLKTLLKN